MRVEIRKLDYLVNLVGELVLERNRLLRLSQDLAACDGKNPALTEAVAISTARLSFITDELQNASLRTRMVPIDNVFRKLPRLVRELSHQVGKEIEIRITGNETEIDKTMIEHIHDPLVHILRNSLDHGIEGTEQRISAGKNSVGTIAVDARQQGDQIVVTIRDDGRGIDSERVRQKIVEKGIYSPEHAAALSRRELLEALFLPGFSTADKVNNLSGRGVGMDVVRTNLRRLNGSVEIESTLGEGTTITLKVPLTMAILPVLLVQVSDEVYAIPLRSVLETVRMDSSAVHCVEGSEVLVLRDRTVPLLRLAPLIGATCDEPASRAVILSINDTRIALAVEALIGQESTVIKPLSALLRDSPYVAGATITGDGRVRLVLDPNNLIRGCSSPYATQ
jgi:two-component system chemotaxis sensor kinase CheA